MAQMTEREQSLREHHRAFWDASTWYRALSLTERLPRQADMNGTAFTSSGTDDHAAARRLQHWKAHPAFKQEGLFAERLDIDSLAEQDLLSALAEPMESLQARTPEAPGWLTALKDAFAVTDASQKIAPLLRKVKTDHPLKGCLPAISPLLQRGLDALGEEVQTLRQQYAVVPVDTELLSEAYLNNIVFDLLFQISKPVILEMHIARLEGRLQGETPGERFAAFMRQLDQDKLILPLLAKYPTLARQLVTTVDQWTEYVGEFLAHLCADWEAVCSTFAVEGDPDPDPGPVVEVQAGMGDRHRRGRSVLTLRFRTGLQVVYKPKPLAVDMHFQELLCWLNERGADPSLRPLKLIDRGDYGWSEFVASSPCASQAEVARFYERQGSYLALLYALDAVDLHNENVIAMGEHPLLVDLEALFHPRIDGADPSAPIDLASRAMDESVWQVGLLPRRLWSETGSPGVDMSGLGGQAGQMLPHPLFRWSEPGSDQMRLIRQHAEMPESENRPRLDGQDVNVLDYRHALLAGFTKMYRLLYEQRDALLTEQVPRFARDEIRVLVRSTRIYATLLFESFHPDLLRDALERDRFFDALWHEAEQRPYLARIIAAERHDLLQGDIPVFTTTPERCTVFTSEGVPLPDFFDTSSLERVRRRILQLSESDLAKQAWIIEASLATLLMGHEDTVEKHVSIKAVRRPVKRERLLALAHTVGKRLEELALQNDAGAYWLGVNYVDEHAWSLFPTGIDLYNGTSGIALFLGYLGAITGEASPTHLARRSLGSLRIQAEHQKKHSETLRIGAFDGLGSLIYLLTHLGILWNDPKLFHEAEQITDQLSALIPEDDHLDIINGAAGCILSLLSLEAVHPSSRILETAIQCGDHLLATALSMPEGIAWKTLPDQPPLGGFSHGAAGIAFSLLKLAARSGQERFWQSALSALAFDRGLFVPELNNWADLREFSTRTSDQPVNERRAEPSHKSMVAWCHGAPGIGLGRLGTLGHLDNAQIREEIDVALKTTMHYGFAGNHSLCHGGLGNADFVLMAAQLLNRREDHEALERATSLLVGSIDTYGWMSAVPMAVETPGFMTGLAGIGYELLRLAEPDKVPSVLLLAPPCSSNHGTAKGERYV